MNRLEYQVAYAGMSLARSAEALLGKPDYFQYSADELPILEAAARETGHKLQVVARPEDPTFTYSRRAGLFGRSHKHFIPLAENGIAVAINKKVTDPWGNRFWRKVIDIREPAEPSESQIAS